MFKKHEYKPTKFASNLISSFSAPKPKAKNLKKLTPPVTPSTTFKTYGSTLTPDPSPSLYDVFNSATSAISTNSPSDSWTGGGGDFSGGGASGSW